MKISVQLFLVKIAPEPRPRPRASIFERSDFTESNGFGEPESWNFLGSLILRPSLVRLCLLCSLLSPGDFMAPSSNQKKRNRSNSHDDANDLPDAVNMAQKIHDALENTG